MSIVDNEEQLPLSVDFSQQNTQNEEFAESKDSHEEFLVIYYATNLMM